jgi:hypothetical protein
MNAATRAYRRRILAAMAAGAILRSVIEDTAYLTGANVREEYISNAAFRALRRDGYIGRVGGDYGANRPIEWQIASAGCAWLRAEACL